MQVLIPELPNDRSTSQPIILPVVFFLYEKNAFYFSVNASNVINKDVYIFDPIYDPVNLENFYVYSWYRYKNVQKQHIMRNRNPLILIKIFESDGRSARPI